MKRGFPLDAEAELLAPDDQEGKREEPGESDLIARYSREISMAITIKFVEERLLELFGQGKLFGTVHTCVGQEWSAVSVGRCLQPQDFVFSNHRCHGHFLSYGGSANALIAEVMGKEDGVCGGRGGSQHLCYQRFFSNGIQGGIAPLAAGTALANQREENGGIAVVFLGDGTLGQGILYETMNIASKWNLPLLFVVENNFYAQSTASHETLSGEIRHRFEAFGIEGMENNTWEWQALLRDMEANVGMVRATGKPRYHVIDTYRLKPHSKGDDNREKEEILRFTEKDPLNVLLRRFAGHPAMEAIIANAQALVDEAVEFGESSKFGSAIALNPQENEENSGRIGWEVSQFDKQRVPASIQAALAAELEGNPKAILIGEDIQGPYGGAFKVTGDLSLRYPGRVRNTPISEPAIVGIGNGLALAGHRPVVEIMFGDFLTLAADQWINHAAKFEYMYNGLAHCPIVVRTPMGGRRGYGPTHSQSLERHFVGLPGTMVLCLHHRMSPKKLYQDIFQTTNCPVLVIENKRLYAMQADPEPPAGFQVLQQAGPFPVTWICSGNAPDVTVVAIGGTSVDAEAAVLEVFDEHDLIADLYLPAALYPLCVDFLATSLQHSRNLVIVEEGLGFAGIGSEIIAQVTERWPDWGIRCQRITSMESPIPTSRPLEEEILPTKERIVQSLLTIAHGSAL
ncbi:MAG: pyruvate dehydrogenase [Bacteroidetes bacterium]|nr:pyruvate dehydrogenase [Bacteroidota bacterium]